MGGTLAIHRETFAGIPLHAFEDRRNITLSNTLNDTLRDPVPYLKFMTRYSTTPPEYRYRLKYYKSFNYVQDRFRKQQPVGIDFLPKEPELWGQEIDMEHEEKEEEWELLYKDDAVSFRSIDGRGRIFDCADGHEIELWIDEDKIAGTLQYMIFKIKEYLSERRDKMKLKARKRTERYCRSGYGMGIGRGGDRKERWRCKDGSPLSQCWTLEEEAADEMKEVEGATGISKSEMEEDAQGENAGGESAQKRSSDIVLPGRDETASEVEGQNEEVETKRESREACEQLCCLLDEEEVEAGGVRAAEKRKAVERDAKVENDYEKIIATLNAYGQRPKLRGLKGGVWKWRWHLDRKALVRNVVSI